LSLCISRALFAARELSCHASQGAATQFTLKLLILASEYCDYDFKQNLYCTVLLWECMHVHVFVCVYVCVCVLCVCGQVTGLLASSWNIPMFGFVGQSPKMDNAAVYDTYIKVVPPLKRIGEVLVKTL